ncbi:hypothetical protein PILCRDRAFT_738456 [Piloderma croceum F 1598]|nr:hypothetical protein PILCRDRAFT_738456 [Piloderma croceum F 1598]
MSTLSINSSDSSHSASDFDNHSPYISNSTLSSTPSSPSVKSSTCPKLRPKHIVLPSAVFASAAFLHDLAATLDKGAGDLVVLCLDYWNNGENAKENTNPPMRFAALAREAGLDFENCGTEWQVIMVTIDGKKVPYFVSEKGTDIELRSINIDDNKRVIKSIDAVLADYKSEFEDQPQSNVSCLSLSSLSFYFVS